MTLSLITTAFLFALEVLFVFGAGIETRVGGRRPEESAAVLDRAWVVVAARAERADDLARGVVFALAPPVGVFFARLVLRVFLSSLALFAITPPGNTVKEKPRSPITHLTHYRTKD
jgi:hypothetical protein